MMCLAIHSGSKAIKNRITYPRTGFVEYPVAQTVWRPMALGFGFAAAASITLYAAIRSHWDSRTLLSLVGVVLAACYAYGFGRSAPWKWAVAAVTAAASVTIALLPPEVIGRVAGGSVLPGLPPAAAGVWLLTLGSYGVILLVSGGISFCLYLRRTRPAERERQ